MTLLIISISLAVLVAFFTCFSSWKYPGEERHKRNNRIAIVLLVSAILTQGLTFYSGYTTNQEKIISDSLNIVKERENKMLSDSLRISQSKIISLQKNLLDTTNKILLTSLSSNLLQQKINGLQSELYNQVTGGNRFEKSFSTFLVIDEQEHMPPLIVPDKIDESNRSAVQFLMHIYDLSNPTTGYGNNTKSIVKKPENTDQTFSFLLELLEYKLFYNLFDIQLGGYSMSGGEGIVSAEVSNLIKLKETTKIPGSKILKILSANQFSKGGMAQDFMKHKYFILPKGANLSLIYIPSSEKTGVEKRKIIISKKGYFKIEFQITPGFASGPGELPKGITANPQNARKYHTYQFIITMIADYENLTLTQTNEYKKWVNWIFSEIERTNSF